MKYFTRLFSHPHIYCYSYAALKTGLFPILILFCRYINSESRDACEWERRCPLLTSTGSEFDFPRVSLYFPAEHSGTLFLKALSKSHFLASVTKAALFFPTLPHQEFINRTVLWYDIMVLDGEMLEARRDGQTKEWAGDAHLFVNAID